MKQTFGLALAVAFASLSCEAETNAVGSTVRFFQPPVELRAYEGWNAAEPAPVASVSPAKEEKVVPRSILDGGDLDATLVQRAERYLYRVAPPSDTPLDRIFRPEVVHLGKTTLSSPFLTVVKRKNPLCLLSGLYATSTSTGDGAIVFRVLEISW